MSDRSNFLYIELPKWRVECVRQAIVDGQKRPIFRDYIMLNIHEFQGKRETENGKETVYHIGFEPSLHNILIRIAVTIERLQYAEQVMLDKVEDPDPEQRFHEKTQLQDALDGICQELGIEGDKHMEDFQKVMDIAVAALGSEADGFTPDEIKHISDNISYVDRVTENAEMPERKTLRMKRYSSENTEK